MSSSEPTTTLLLVDDEPRVLDSLEALLAADYRILRAQKAEEALALLGAEDVALIVSDQRMPGMTGTELLARTRELAPDTVRVLLTAFTDADALMASINAAHIYQFVLKPWDPKELVHTVRRGVEHYTLTREREQLVHDLAEKNRDLEEAVGRLRTAQAELVQEAGLRAQIQRYVSPRLVDLVVADPTLLAPGDWREATVLSADIAGFTRLTETNPAPVVIRLLDEYLSAMTDTIFRHGGTVEQLIGDEIVALFGVPEPDPDSPAQAVAAALDMVRTVRDLARRWSAAGLPVFKIGVGLSTGRVMAGTIGSDRRRELVVVGRPMIAAARIQRMTRLFGAPIIADQPTFQRVEGRVRHRELGTPRLKGIKERQTLYAIVAARDALATAAAP